MGHQFLLQVLEIKYSICFKVRRPQYEENHCIKYLVKRNLAKPAGIERKENPELYNSQLKESKPKRKMKKGGQN